MIKTFKRKHTEALCAGERCHRQWQAFRGVAERTPRMLNRAHRLDDPRVPPQSRLEALKGDRVGQWGVRINDQWRIGFTWSEGDAHDVEVVDFHLRKPSMSEVKNGMRPSHPGEVLREEFLIPMGLSAHAMAIAVPAPRINDIVREKRGVTADTALRKAEALARDALDRIQAMPANA